MVHRRAYRNFFWDFEFHTTGASASSEAPRSAQILGESGLNRGISRGQGQCVISNTLFCWRSACFHWRLRRRRKLGLPFELAAATVTPQHARMATTGMPRMPAHLTATTVRTGLSAESSSAPGRGSMDIGALVSIAVLAFMVVASMVVASTGAASTGDPDLLGAADSFAALSFAAVSAAAQVDSTVVVSAAADTDNSTEI
jgi:hypothetical protein